MWLFWLSTDPKTVRGDRVKGWGYGIFKRAPGIRSPAQWSRGGGVTERGKFWRYRELGKEGQGGQLQESGGQERRGERLRGGGLSKRRQGRLLFEEKWKKEMEG